MAMEAVVVVVIQKLTVMLIEQPVVFDKVIDQVEEIRIMLRRMRGFLIDAEENQRRDPKVKDWAHSYLPILYQVEDIVETFALRIACQTSRRRRSTNTRFGGRALFNHCQATTTSLFFFFNNLRACQKLRLELARIGNEINHLNNGRPPMVQDLSFKYHSELSFRDQAESSSRHQHDDDNLQRSSSISFGRDSYHDVNDRKDQAEEEDKKEEEEEEEEITADVRTPGRRASSGKHLSTQPTFNSTYSYEDQDSGVVGFQEDVKALVKRLTKEEEDDDSNILSIFGEVGSGKTTLAQSIYGSKNVRNHFDSRAWVFVSKDHTEKDVLFSLLKQVDKNFKDQGALDVKQLLSKLLELLGEKKCLLVIDMDDVSSCDLWKQLNYAFANSSRNGSKIIITTSTCKHPSSPPHYMKELRNEESWKVFLKKAHFRDQDIFQLQPKILELCKGLPLRIVLLGGLLSAKRESFDEWTRVLDHIDQDASRNPGQEGAQGIFRNGEFLAILSFCYNDLPVHSKLCLLYLVLFPKEFNIPVRRLVRLWLAEGFVRRSPTLIPEDLAQEYFDDLVKRNMIQVSKWRSDGSPRRCRLPGALHDYLQPKTQDIRLFRIHRNSDCPVEEKDAFGLRRIVEYLDIKKDPPEFSQIEHLRSYISFNLQKKDIPARKVAKFIGKIIGNRGFALLNVLDLEGVYKPSLPDKLGDLFRLRYLGLRWTFLDHLPSSVGDLQYLETLDLKRTDISSLPKSIWKLRHLRHLNLNEIRLDMPPGTTTPLTGLLTLWGLFVDDKSPVKELSRLRNLRELGLTYNLSENSSKDLALWISNLTNLQSLRLRSKDEMGHPSNLHLDSLSRLGKLTHLNLLGNIEKLPQKNEFPPTLKVLTLSVSKLTEDPMPTLGQLPSLTVLRLLADSCQRKEIVCTLRGFRELRVLKLWMLNNLEEWEVKEGAMQNLKELNIRCCSKLRTLPLCLLQQGTLEELTLTNMPARFVENVRDQKSEDTSLIVNNWTFTPLPWEQDK